MVRSRMTISAFFPRVIPRFGYTAEGQSQRLGYRWVARSLSRLSSFRRYWRYASCLRILQRERPFEVDGLKTLVIGTDPHPPFVSDDADGNTSGIDVDIPLPRR